MNATIAFPNTFRANHPRYLYNISQYVLSGTFRHYKPPV